MKTKNQKQNEVKEMQCWIFDPDRLRELRELRGWSVQGFVDLYNERVPDNMKLSRQKLRQWETGKHRIDSDAIPNLARLLGVVERDLYKETQVN